MCTRDPSACLTITIDRAMAVDLEAATMAPSMRQVTERIDNISYGHKLGVSLPPRARHLK